jgi:hypothetical protein
MGTLVKDESQAVIEVHVEAPPIANQRRERRGGEGHLALLRQIGRGWEITVPILL